MSIVGAQLNIHTHPFDSAIAHSQYMPYPKLFPNDHQYLCSDQVYLTPVVSHTHPYGSIWVPISTKYHELPIQVQQFLAHDELINDSRIVRSLQAAVEGHDKITTS